MAKLSGGRFVGLYVRQCVGLSSALWKNGGSDTDAVWHQTGPGMRQVVGFGDQSTGRDTFGARHCIQWGLYTAYVCDSASTVGASVRDGACGGPRHCCIRWGPRHARGRERFGGFVPHFHSKKCHWVADGEMFPIRMRKFDNISVRQT